MNETGSESSTTPEDTSSPEAVGNTREQEAGKIGKTLTFRSIAETPDSRDDTNLAKGLRLIKTLHQIKIDNPEPVDFENPWNLESVSIPVEDVTSKTIRLQNISQVLGLVRKEGALMAHCNYIGSVAQGKGSEKFFVDVPIDDLLIGQLVSVQESFLATFSDEEQGAVAAYIASLPGGEGGKAKEMASGFLSEGNLDSATETIKKLASESGYLTVDDLDALIPKVEDGETMTPEQEETKKQLEALKEKLGGKVILTPEVLSEALSIETKGGTGNVEELKLKLASIEQEAAILYEAMKKGDKKAELAYRQKMADRDAIQIELEVANLSKPETRSKVVSNYYSKLDSGEISPETARAFVEGFKKGQFIDVLKNIVAPQKREGESQEAFEKRQDEFLLMQKINERSNSLGLLAVIALLIIAGESFSAIEAQIRKAK